MPANHATDTTYSADQLDAVYVLLSEARHSLAAGDSVDCDNCITAALERLGLAPKEDSQPTNRSTPYGEVVFYANGATTIVAHEGNLTDWAHRAGAVWPCSTLASLALPDCLTVRFAANGDLVDLEGTSVGIPADELTAWTDDAIAAARAPEPIAAFLADVYKAGVAAGSWVIDGNTSEETARRLLQGIEDGDPAIMDELPGPSWNGEWAGEPTYEQLARDAGLSEDESDDTYAEALAAFSQGVEDEVTRAARYIVGLGEERS